MFNKTLNALKKISAFLLICLLINACSKDVKISFYEAHISQTKNANIDINYLKAEGTKDVAKRINTAVEQFIGNETNLSDTPDKNATIAQAVTNFDNDYIAFKNQFEDTNQIWEFTVDSEISYQSAEVICMTLSSYTDTGGAHGNGQISFLNFNSQTGDLLKQKDIIKDVDGFKTLAETYFKNETKSRSDDESIEDYFFGKGFQLPANIGFSDEGLVLLYNTYEIASYAQGVTEFTIPYSEAKPFLKVN